MFNDNLTTMYLMLSQILFLFFLKWISDFNFIWVIHEGYLLCSRVLLDQISRVKEYLVIESSDEVLFDHNSIKGLYHLD